MTEGAIEGDSSREFTIQPIGVVRSAFQNPEDVWKSDREHNRGEIVVFPAFAEGLKDIDGFSHILIIFHFDRSKHVSTKARPPFKPRKERGVFATHSPNRPNKLGVTVSRLLERKGRVLVVEGIDMLDRTPVIDIKPYTRSYAREITGLGWIDESEFQNPVE